MTQDPVGVFNTHACRPGEILIPDVGEYEFPALHDDLRQDLGGIKELGFAGRREKQPNHTGRPLRVISSRGSRRHCLHGFRTYLDWASPSFLLIFRQILNPFGVKALCKAKCYPNS